jgi:hypothetical protein
MNVTLPYDEWKEMRDENARLTTALTAERTRADTWRSETMRARQVCAEQAAQLARYAWQPVTPGMVLEPGAWIGMTADGYHVMPYMLGGQRPEEYDAVLVWRVPDAPEVTP